MQHWSSTRWSGNWIEPDAFKPERWLGDTRYENDDKQALQNFSVGPRNCVGKNLAWFEMRSILARLIWNFDMELGSGVRDWPHQNNYVLWEKPPLPVKLTAVVR